MRRWNIDPIRKVSVSLYSCFNGNPVWLSDRHGADGDTTFRVRADNTRDLFDYTVTTESKSVTNLDADSEEYKAWVKKYGDPTQSSIFTNLSYFNGKNGTSVIVRNIQLIKETKTVDNYSTVMKYTDEGASKLLSSETSGTSVTTQSVYIAFEVVSMKGGMEVYSRSVDPTHNSGFSHVSTTKTRDESFSGDGFPTSFAPVALYARTLREGYRGASLATISGYEGTIELFSNIGYYTGYVGGVGTGLSVPCLQVPSKVTNAIGWATFVLGAISSEVSSYYEAKHRKLSVHNTFNSNTVRQFKLSDGKFGPND